MRNLLIYPSVECTPKTLKITQELAQKVMPAQSTELTRKEALDALLTLKIRLRVMSCPYFLDTLTQNPTQAKSQAFWSELSVLSDTFYNYALATPREEERSETIFALRDILSIRGTEQAVLEGSAVVIQSVALVTHLMCEKILQAVKNPTLPGDQKE